VEGGRLGPFRGYAVRFIRAGLGDPGGECLFGPSQAGGFRLRRLEALPLAVRLRRVTCRPGAAPDSTSENSVWGGPERPETQPEAADAGAERPLSVSSADSVSQEGRDSSH
jgi:hypothetical protein